MNGDRRTDNPLPADGYVLPWMFNGASILPLRSFSDFLLSFSHYQIPLVHGLGNWINQIVNNLLYYQTNYFCIFVALLMLFGWAKPAETTDGILVLIGLWFIIAVCNVFIPRDHLFRRFLNITILRWILILVLISSVGKTKNSSALIIGLMILSSSVAVVHAALRRQNIENELFNTVGANRLSYTVMGIILEHLHIVRFEYYQPRRQQ